MSGDEAGWPADPTDPKCPECGGAVSATASYCLHCESDLPEAAVDVTGGAEPVVDDRAEAGGRSGAAERGWLHPDSLLDDVSTVAVGIGGGLLAGIALTILLAFPLPEALPFGVGVVGWLAATVWIARTRTVFGAVRKAGYLVGGLLAALPPVVAATAPMAEDGLGARLGLLLVLCILVWPVAGGAAVVGYLGGRGRPTGADG